MQTNANEYAVVFRMKEGSRKRVANCPTIEEARDMEEAASQMNRVILGIYQKIE